MKYYQYNSSMNENNDVLEAAPEEINNEQNEYDHNESDEEDNQNIANIRDEYGFCDPNRLYEHTESHTGYDTGIAQSARHDPEVDCSGTKMTGIEYTQLMQSLNLKQS